MHLSLIEDAEEEADPFLRVRVYDTVNINVLLVDEQPIKEEEPTRDAAGPIEFIDSSEEQQILEQLERDAKREQEQQDKQVHVQNYRN